MPRNNLDKPRARMLKADKTFNRKCGRIRYATPVDATIALGGLPEGKIIRKCPNCGGYHLLNPNEHLQSRKGSQR